MTADIATLPSLFDRAPYLTALVQSSLRIIASGRTAAGLTSVAKNAASAIPPAFAGATLANPALGLPFLIAGGLKIVYDLTIFAVFRGVRPPEETQSTPAPASGRSAAAAFSPARGGKR